MISGEFGSPCLILAINRLPNGISWRMPSFSVDSGRELSPGIVVVQVARLVTPIWAHLERPRDIAVPLANMRDLEPVHLNKAPDIRTPIYVFRDQLAYCFRHIFAQESACRVGLT